MDDRRTIAEAIKNKAGELETMKVLQLKLARTIDESSSGRDIAALSRQLREVTARITELEALGDQEDEILAIIKERHDRSLPGPVRDRNHQALYQEG